MTATAPGAAALLPRRRTPSWQALARNLARAAGTPYFWLAAAMLGLAGLLHYFGAIATWIKPDLPWGLGEYSMDRALFLLPISYAGFVFGSAGGLTALALAAAMLIPGCVTCDHRLAAFTETGAVLLVGALVVNWFEAQAAEKERRRRTLYELVRTQQDLHAHVKALQSEEKVLGTLNAVYFLCSQSLDLDEILRDSLDKVMEVMDVDMAVVFLLDEERGDLRMAAHRGVSETFVQEVSRLYAGEGLNGWVAATGRPLAVADVAADARLCKPVVIREGIESELLVPVRARGRIFGTLCVGTRYPREFRPEDIDLLGACGNALGVAIENARLYQQVRGSEMRYRDLFEHASDAIFAHDLDGRIFAANEACAKLTGYDKDELLSMKVASFFSAEDLEKAQVLERELLAGTLDGQDQRLEISLRRKDGTTVTVELASTVVSGDSGPRGIQHIAHDITEQRRARETMQSYVREITRAQEEERLRISRDLHDETAQSLLLVSQRLDGLVSDPRWQLSEEAKRTVGDIRGLALQTLADLRRISEALRPRILDDLGLIPAVGWIADQLVRQAGIDVHLEVLGSQRELPRDQEVLLFRIAQEALSNVRRHAHARRVDVVVEFGDGSVALTVCDDGRGFVMPAAPGDLAATGKLGILGMMERARLLGGRLSVCSEPGQGTRVRVDVPG